MQEIGLVGGDEEANKRRKKSIRVYPKRRVRRALFLSGMLFSLGASVFALAPEISTEERMDAPSERISDIRKELCVIRLERGFWESFAERDTENRQSDGMAECAGLVYGEESLVSTGVTELESEIRLLVAGTPMEAMAPHIARFDREIAALLVGIAKKESSWGQRVPLDAAGEDCFNYWGYKGAGARGVAMGHGCFGSPEEAVRMVGDRLVELVALRQTSEPENMIIWKCGSSCAGHSPESVRKWIADVDLYYQKIAKL